VQGLARAVGRGSPGMAQGRFAGLSAVERGGSTGGPQQDGIVWSLDYDDYWSATVDVTSPQDEIDTPDEGGGPLTLIETQAASWVDNSSDLADITERGLFLVNVTLIVDIPDTAFVKFGIISDLSGFSSFDYDMPWSSGSTARSISGSWLVPSGTDGSDTFNVHVWSDDSGGTLDGTSTVDIFRVLHP
jgi:hypothetical protein